MDEKKEEKNCGGVCKCSCGNSNLFPPGFEFDPSDKELLEDYLKKKIMNEPFPFHDIMHSKFLELNLYTLDNPDILEENYKLGPEDKKWFIFTSRDKMNPNGKRPKRSAGVGFWKATVGDKPVRHNGTIVGKKKLLTFYIRGPSKVEKTNWLMHEYTIPDIKRPIRSRDDKRLDDWVLCKVYKKKPAEDEKPPEEEEVEATEEVKTPVVTLEEKSKPIEEVTVGPLEEEEEEGVLQIDIGELERSIEYCYGSIYKASLIQDQGTTEQQQQPTNTNNSGLEKQQQQQQQHYGTMTKNQTLPLQTSSFFNQFYEDLNWVPQVGPVSHKLGLWL